MASTGLVLITGATGRPETLGPALDQLHPTRPAIALGLAPSRRPPGEDMADHSGFGRESADRHQSWLPSDPPVGALLGGRSPEFQQLDRGHAAAVWLAQLQRGRIRHLLQFISNACGFHGPTGKQPAAAA
jgi:hypothetical protein